MWGDGANKWSPSSPLTVSIPSGLFLPTETPSFPLLQFPRPWPKQEPIDRSPDSLSWAAKPWDWEGNTPLWVASRGPKMRPDPTCLCVEGHIVVQEPTPTADTGVPLSLPAPSSLPYTTAQSSVAGHSPHHTTGTQSQDPVYCFQESQISDAPGPKRSM